MLVKVNINLFVHVSLLSLQGNNIIIQCSKFEMKSKVYCFENASFLHNGKVEEYLLYRISVEDVAWLYLGEAK